MADSAGGVPDNATALTVRAGVQSEQEQPASIDVCST